MVGVDVGGTKVLAVVVQADDPARILAQAERPTPVGLGGGALVDTIAAVYHESVGSLPEPSGEAVRHLGLGLPGLVDRAGTLRYGPHLPGVVDARVDGLLAARLGIAVSVDNDGNCAALAEACHGGGRGHGHVLFVGLGTGISCGMVIDGQLLRGGHGFAGEPGHFVIDPAGPPCACGRRGCWESLASGTGLAHLANRASAAARGGAATRSDDAPVGGGWRATRTDELRGEDVTVALAGGEPWAAAVLAEFAGWVAKGLAVLVALFDPDVIVLGGSMMVTGEALLGPIRSRLAEEVFRPAERGGPPLVGAELGRRAGAVGAAMLAATAAASPPGSAAAARSG